MTATFDQNLIPDVQFFADAFYSNRRSTAISSTGSSAPWQTSALSVAVPTSNPYYPIGAPSNLTVYYSLAYESPIRLAANEVAGRYDAGFNLDLPFEWIGKLYASSSEDKIAQVITGEVNPNGVSAALGWTVPAAAGGASYAKPANVPYLNLFCDPTHFACNSPATLVYIEGYRNYFESNIYNEFGLTLDGPVYALPAGVIKAAVGAVYNTYDFDIIDNENYNNQSTAIITQISGPVTRNVVATYAQLNIPFFGNNFTLPLVESLNVETSFRFDHYSDVGNTTNPKVSATWGVIDGLQVKAAWGTAFRAPSPPNVQAVSGGLLQGNNTAAGAATNTVSTFPTVGKAAVAGSPAAILDPNCIQALQFLGGITLSGGEEIASAVRAADYELQPEKAQNISAGIEWAPVDDIFKGLDLGATYYFVKIRDKLQGCAFQGLDSPINANCVLYAQNDPNFQQQGRSAAGQSEIAASHRRLSDVDLIHIRRSDQEYRMADR